MVERTLGHTLLARFVDDGPWTLAEVAGRLDITRQYLWMILEGQRRPAKPLRRRIERETGINWKSWKVVEKEEGRA